MMKKLKKTLLMFALLFTFALGAWGCGQADEDEAAELEAIEELEEESAAALDNVWDEDVSSGSERLHCVIKTMATVITRRANVSTIAK